MSVGNGDGSRKLINPDWVAPGDSEEIHLLTVLQGVCKCCFIENCIYKLQSTCVTLQGRAGSDGREAEHAGRHPHRACAVRGARAQKVAV